MRSLFTLIFCIAYFPAFTQYCQANRFDDTLFTKGQIQLSQNVMYGEAVDWQDTLRDLFLDVYAPDLVFDTIPLRPLIIYLHGGGFHAGSKSTSKGIYWGGEFARRGFVFASVDYRIGWTFSDSCTGDSVEYLEALYRAAQDVRAAYRYLVEYAADYAVDTNEIYLLGSSAGAAAAMMTVYMQEEDFHPFLPASLGPLETSSNAITGHPLRFRGIVTKSAAVNTVRHLENASVPQILFHGNCDLTVPYYEGPLFHCYPPGSFIRVKGSGLIANQLEEQGVCFTLYRSLGNGHVAAEDDTVVIHGSEFIKSILCETCETKRWDRFSGKNICKVNAGRELVVETVYPVPADHHINVVVSVPFSDRVLFRIYDMKGKKHIEYAELFEVPTNEITLDVSALPPGNYLLRVGDLRRSNGHIVQIY